MKKTKSVKKVAYSTILKYFYIIFIIIVIALSFFLYSFLKKYVYNPIFSPEFADVILNETESVNKDASAFNKLEEKVKNIEHNFELKIQKREIENFRNVFK